MRNVICSSHRIDIMIFRTALCLRTGDGDGDGGGRKNKLCMM